MARVAPRPCLGESAGSHDGPQHAPGDGQDLRRVAADHGERYLRTGLAAQQSNAFEHGHVARRPAINGADVVAGLKSGFCGRGSVTRIVCGSDDITAPVVGSIALAVSVRFATG